MTALTLFDLAQQVRESVSKVDPDTGEIIESYAESRELFQSKAVACVAYAKEEASTLESAEAMVKDMLAKIEARKKRRDEKAEQDRINALWRNRVKRAWAESKDRVSVAYRVLRDGRDCDCGDDDF